MRKRMINGMLRDLEVEEMFCHFFGAKQIVKTIYHRNCSRHPKQGKNSLEQAPNQVFGYFTLSNYNVNLN